MNQMIPIDYQKFTHPKITDSMKAAVMRQMDDAISIYDYSGIYKEFEQNFASTMGLLSPYNEYCLSTSSGTTALYSLYFGAFASQNLLLKDVAVDDDYVEVIVPSYGFFATVTPLLQLNMDKRIKMKFADCLMQNGNIDPKQILEQITNKTAAVIIVHVWGNVCDLKEIQEICDEHNILLFQDSSHAHGATVCLIYF